ncbi:MAG: hypothetical protein WCP99_01780 [Burkholderiales bacterium]
MEQKRQQFEDISAAVDHLESSVSAGSIAAGAAKGILYGLFEAVGTIIGDPDLPEHIRSGYDGLQETLRELGAKLGS